MNTEVELKLAITTENILKLKDCQALKHLALGDPITKHIENTYYDTPELDLSKRKYALRIRQIGDQILQTLKGEGTAFNGLHQRDEWEYPIDEEINVTLFPTEVQSWLLPLRDQLIPLFTTHFERTTWNLEFEGSKIELALDQGTIEAGEFQEAISEIELELKSGEIEALLKLLVLLQEELSLTPEDRNKAERGYYLFSLQKHETN